MEFLPNHCRASLPELSAGQALLCCVSASPPASGSPAEASVWKDGGEGFCAGHLSPIWTCPVWDGGRLHLSLRWVETCHRTVCPGEKETGFDEPAAALAAGGEEVGEWQRALVLAVPRAPADRVKDGKQIDSDRAKERDGARSQWEATQGRSQSPERTRRTAVRLVPLDFLPVDGCTGLRPAPDPRTQVAEVF